MITLNHSLKSQLSQFGLNPADWILIPKTESLIDIINFEEPNLKLIGAVTTTDSEASSWDSIYYLDQ